MTTTTLWDRSTVDEAEAAHTGPATRRRRLRWVVIAAVVALIAVVMTWQSPGPATREALDPRNPSPTGAQALARVLADHGVAVTVARGQTELERAGADAGTTVLVATTGDLAEETIDRLATATLGARRLVVVNPDPWVVRYLSPDIDVKQRRRSSDDFATTGTGCTTTDVRAGERVSHSQSEFRLLASLPAAACLTHDGHSVYLALPASSRHAPLVLFGSTSALTNEEFDDADNAAIVLRTLGQSPRLVWYVPSISDVPVTDRSRASDLLPPWLGPGLLLVTIAVLFVLLWRGRRLGRLVREPLPVVVRAVETTESRGRIYRRARDASRAALVLQDATRRRAAGYLGLPVTGSPETLMLAVAAASGRRPEEVDLLLHGPPPSADRHLLGLAAQLAALEKEVRRT
ncbi:DUF4350 domain-containing protein [Lapillicoccus sp.]|uniref:DUF4350 domain-containing protein n=1 Tax=Lapillicoccus sp. TaxID=1909287 RepID=UPI0039833034